MEKMKKTKKRSLKDEKQTDPTLVSTFKGHNSSVTSVSFNPNM